MREKSNYFLIALIVLHSAIAVPLAFYLNIWIDEASTLYTTQNGFFYALQNAGAYEKQAPLYFWILSLWRSLNDSIFFARIFSIVFSILAIKVFYDLTRKFFDEKQALFVTAFFAVHPYLIWASTEIRLYSTVIFLSILILNLFVEIFLKEPISGKQNIKSVLFVVFSTVALYTNYYLGFLLVGCFAALLILKRWTAAKRYFLQMLIVGLFFLPLLWTIKSQFDVNSAGFQTERHLLEGVKVLWNYFLTFALPTEVFPAHELGISTFSFVRLWLVRILIFAAVIFLVKSRRIFDKNILAAGSICAVMMLFLLAAYFLLGEKYVAIRHAAVLFAPVILLLALIVNAFLEWCGEKNMARENFLFKAAAIFSTIFVAVFFAYSIFMLYPNLTKRGDWARISEFIEENEKVNQPIIVFPNYDALALPVYYQGANKILPDKNFFDWELEAAPDDANNAKKQTEFIISEIPAATNEIWLLVDSTCPHEARCQPLENFVQANYTIVVEKDFFKEKVRLLRRK